MFNLGFSELIILGAIALIFIGPKQLPEVARTLGKLINEWKRATSDLTSSFTENEAFKDWEQRRKNYLADVDPEVKKEETPLEEPGAQLELDVDEKT